MDKSEWGVHEHHCCGVHRWCKYNDDDCPVANGLTKQEYPCEWCDETGYDTKEKIDEYIELRKTIKVAKELGAGSILISIELLERLMGE